MEKEDKPAENVMNKIDNKKKDVYFKLKLTLAIVFIVLVLVIIFFIPTIQCNATTYTGNDIVNSSRVYVTAFNFVAHRGCPI